MIPYILYFIKVCKFGHCSRCAKITIYIIILIVCVSILRKDEDSIRLKFLSHFHGNGRYNIKTIRPTRLVCIKYHGVQQRQGWRVYQNYLHNGNFYIILIIIIAILIQKSVSRTDQGGKVYRCNHNSHRHSGRQSDGI